MDYLSRTSVLPVLFVEYGTEGGGDQEVVVAVGDGAVVGGGVPDAPADALAGTGEDFVLAVFDFVPELAGIGFVIF